MLRNVIFLFLVSQCYECSYTEVNGTAGQSGQSCKKEDITKDSITKIACNTKCFVSDVIKRFKSFVGRRTYRSFSQETGTREGRRLSWWSGLLGWFFMRSSVTLTFLAASSSAVTLSFMAWSCLERGPHPYGCFILARDPHLCGYFSRDPHL